jgi:hypothetical protein
MDRGEYLNGDGSLVISRTCVLLNTFVKYENKLELKKKRFVGQEFQIGRRWTIESSV